MKRLVSVLIAALVTTIVYLGYAEWRFRVTRAETNAQIARLAESVNRLATMMEQVLRERSMADVNVSDGESSLNHATTVEWTSGTQTVQLTVYKNSSTETAAEYRKQVADATDKYMQQYPPNLN